MSEKKDYTINRYIRPLGFVVVGIFLVGSALYKLFL